MTHLAVKFVATALGIIVPALVLTVRGDEAMSPFGWPRVAVVHLVALIPLGLLTMHAVARRLPGPSPWLAGLGLFVGLGLAWWTAAQRVALGNWLDTNDAAFVSRLLVRLLWCQVLALPWWLIGGFLLGDVSRQTRTTRPAGMLVLAMVVAVFCPLLFARTLIRAQTDRAEELFRGGRLVPLKTLTQALISLGSRRPIAGLPPRTLQGRLHRELREFTLAVMDPLPKTATSDERRERGRILALLDRLDDADWLLAPMKSDPGAVLLRAAIQQQLKHFAYSDELYRTGLELAKELPAKDRLSAKIRAYDGLAFNARAQSAPEKAEAIYQEALQVVPEAKAHFHFQLGRHYELAGRPTLALDHLRAAVALNPRQFTEPARPLLDKLLTQTPGCLLRPVREKGSGENKRRASRRELDVDRVVASALFTSGSRLDARLSFIRNHVASR